MEASVIESPKQIRIVEIPVPSIGREDVLIKIEGTGLCVSNLPVWEGREWFKYPFEPGSPGHEGYGTVEKVGEDVIGISPGDRVAFISCHAFAQFDKTHMSNVVKIPRSVGSLPFPGEPLACAVNILKRSSIEKGQIVTVVGTGYIGCLLIQLLKHAGAQVIAVSRRSSSLGFAEKCGADHLVKFTGTYETAKFINEISGGGTERVIEATGYQNSLDLATEIISIRGKLVIAGYHQDGLRQINMQQWNWKGIDVVNAHERDRQAYAVGLKEAVTLAEEGILRPGVLITHIFDFRDINQAFELLERKPEGFLKAIVTYS